MRFAGTAALAVLTVIGCVYRAPPRLTEHYADRISAPSPIPKEYDPVVAEVAAHNTDSTPDSLIGTTVSLDQPISLEQAQEIALFHSPKIAEARSAVSIAAARERGKFAAFLPTVGTSYAFQAFSSDTGFVGIPAGGRFPVLPVRGVGPGNQDFEVLDVRVQWTVFQFGKRIALHDQSEIRFEISRWLMERTQQEVVFDVALNYAKVLQARASHVVAERAVVRADAALNEVRNLTENGVLTREDTLRAEVFLADVRQELIAATSESQITVAGLNRSMGINVSLPTRVIERSEELEEYPFSLEVCLARAITGRPEFSIVRLGVAAAGRGADATRADFLPTITTTGGGALVEGNGIQNAKVGDAGITIKWNLFEGGRRVAELREAEAEIAVAMAQGQHVCDTIAFETHIAFRNIEDALGRLKQSRTATGQAAETLRLVRNRYHGGDAKPTDIVDAETALIKAEQNINSARYDLLIALARMKFATGGIDHTLAPKGVVTDAASDSNDIPPTSLPVIPDGPE